jgi:DNA polymerase III delta subunit
MAEWSAEELFTRTVKDALTSTLLLQGEDPYLEREWKKLLSKQSFELHQVDLKKSSPTAAHEELAQGGSLFSSRSLVWFHKPAPLSQWKAEAKNVWKKMTERADGASLVVVLQAASDKRSNWSALAIEAQAGFAVDARKQSSWLKRMNEQRGAPLKPVQLEFLAGFEADLMTLDNWVELWSLGGDLWAEKSLGWGSASAKERNSLASTVENPAYAWVEAVLRADRTQASRLLKILWDQGQEPLQLLALLSKSVKILASLEEGGRAAGAPEFLVNKMRAIARQNAARSPRRGSRLLHECANLDRQLKSSPIHAFAALMSL